MQKYTIWTQVEDGSWNYDCIIDGDNDDLVLEYIKQQTFQTGLNHRAEKQNNVGITLIEIDHS